MTSQISQITLLRLQLHKNESRSKKTLDNHVSCPVIYRYTRHSQKRPKGQSEETNITDGTQTQ